MANKYNVYAPTHYVPLPVDDYRMSLAANETDALEKVQRLSAGLAAYKQITPIGQDATAFHRDLISGIETKVGEIGRKNLKSYDAIREINAIVQDPNILSGMKDLYSDAREYGAMMESMKKYREKNPDINLTPQLMALHRLGKQKGDAKAYRPGMFRGLDSAPEYFDTRKELFAVLDKMKGNSKEWMSGDGKRVYTNYEEALTDPRIRKAAFDTLNADPKMRDQIQRDIAYSAFVNNPDDPQAYFKATAQSLRDEFKGNMETNDAAIKALEKQIANGKMLDGTKIGPLERKNMEDMINNFKAQNKGFSSLSSMDDQQLTYRTHLDRFADAGADIFAYSKKKQTWEYDKVYLESLNHQHALQRQREKQEADKKLFETHFGFSAHQLPKIQVASTEGTTENSLRNLGSVPGLEILKDIGGNITTDKLDFKKPIGSTKVMGYPVVLDLVKNGVLKEGDVYVSNVPFSQRHESLLSKMSNMKDGRSLIGIPGNRIIGFTSSGVKKMKELGYTVHNGSAITENMPIEKEVKLEKGQLVEALRKNYPGLEKIQFATTEQKNGKTVQVPFTLDLSKDIDKITDNELATAVNWAAKFEHEKAVQGVNTWTFGGPMAGVAAKEANAIISNSISGRKISIGGKEYNANQLPRVLDKDGKERSIQDYIQGDKVRPMFTMVNGRTWAVYDVQGLGGINNPVMIEYPELSDKMAGSMAASKTAQDGFIPNGDGTWAYAEHQLIPGEQGGHTMGTRVYSTIGNEDVQRFVKAYAYDFPNPKQQDIDLVRQQAYEHINNLLKTQPIQSDGNVFDPLTKRAIPAIRIFKNPTTGLLDEKFADYESSIPVMTPKGLRRYPGPLPGDAYDGMKLNEYFNEFVDQNVRLPKFQYNQSFMQEFLKND